MTSGPERGHAAEQSMSVSRAGPLPASGSLQAQTSAPLSQTRVGRPPRKRLAIAAIVVVGVASGTMLQSWSDNQSSHYDLVRALDAGRTTIDYGPYPTKDKAFYKGHFYSARAPGLAIYSLPFYELLKAADAPAVARASHALRGEDEMI